MILLLSVFLGGFLLGVLAVVVVVLYALNRLGQVAREVISNPLSAIEKLITDDYLVRVFYKFVIWLSQKTNKQESSDESEEGMWSNVDPQQSLDFTHNKEERESWDMNTPEKIEAAGKKKEEGNTLFKVGKYARASKRYEKAVKYIEYDSAFSEEEKKQAKVLKVACNLNNAACKLKLKDYKQAEKLCTKVLELESRNVKALYRRAQAYIQLADLDLAEFDIKKALEIDPDNREVKLEYKTLKERIKEYNRKEAKFYGNMFAKMNKLEPLEANKSAAKEAEPMSVDSKA